MSHFSKQNIPNEAEKSKNLYQDLNYVEALGDCF